MSDNPYETGGPSVVEPTDRGRGRWIALLLCCVAVVLVLSFFITPVRSAREAARRTQCKGHLKQIALALHNYHDVYETFPPAYTTNADGERLHSWRTLILPFLEQQALYESIDLSKPWDHPDNVQAHNRTPTTYRCPSTDLEPNQTTYVGIVGDEFAFHPTAGRGLDEFPDGTSNTIFVTEVSTDKAVPWMCPDDAIGVKFLTQQLSADSETAHVGGVQGSLVDGSIRYFSAKTARSAWHALITIDGGEDL